MRSFGYKQDAPDARDRRFGMQVIGEAPAGALSLVQYRPRRLEQDGVSSCVGHALARAIHVCLRGEGEEPSPLFLYANARLGEYAGQDPRTVPLLSDSGCYPRIAMQAVRELGFCRESDWPFETWRADARPERRCYRNAFDQRALTYYRIDSAGTERIADLRLALSLGYPVMFGMPVDRAFTEHVGPAPIDSLDLDQIEGGHAMCVLGHDPARGVHVDNWWGTDWGERDGMGWISDDLFGAPILGDVYAIVAAPIYTG